MWGLWWQWKMVLEMTRGGVNWGAALGHLTVGPDRCGISLPSNARQASLTASGRAPLQPCALAGPEVRKLTISKQGAWYVLSTS